MPEKYSETMYEEGLKCEWGGVSTSDMTREHLIAFIGMLDYSYTKAVRELKELDA